MFDGLSGKAILVTGASGAIGSAMARLFAQHGAAVGLHYADGQRQVLALQRAIRHAGGVAECFQGDLLELGRPQALLRAFLKRFGAIDVLVNNAGAVFGARSFIELDERSWERTMTLNARAPFFLARQAFRHMQRTLGGKIINISSIAARYGGSTNTMHYGAAKAALEAMTIGMARAGARHRILVNAIQAGFIRTPFHGAIADKNIRKRIAMIPLQRAGTPMDVAQTALFLASSAGDFITGQIVVVSGGD